MSWGRTKRASEPRRGALVGALIGAAAVVLLLGSVIAAGAESTPTDPSAQDTTTTAATDPPTSPPTDPPTSPPTDPPTSPPTDPPTTPPTDPATTAPTNPPSATPPTSSATTTTPTNQVSALSTVAPLASEGTLTVTKVVVGNPGGNQTFTVHVDCGGATSDLTFHWDNTAHSVVEAPQQVGPYPDKTKCTVTETGTAGATVSTSPKNPTINGGADVGVTVTNTYQVANVTICHRTNSVTNPYVQITVDESAVDGDSGNDNGKGDHLKEHTGPVFDPNVSYPPPHNGDQWGDIIPPFDANGGPRPNTSLTLNWPAGEDIFNNGCAVAVPGSLTVVKSVVGTPPNGATFTVDVDCDDGKDHDRQLTFNSAGTLTGGGPLPITGIPAGTTCTVSESGQGGASNVVVAGSPATIVAGETKTVTVINSFDTTTGNLTVTKSVVGTPPDGTTFTVGVDCSDGTAHDATLTFNSAGTLTGGSLPITGIPDGTTCAVTESGTGGASKVDVTGSPATIVKGQTKSVGVTNTFSGSLDVTKSVVGTPQNGATFTVDVDCSDGTTHDATLIFNSAGTLTSGGPLPITGIPAGTTCTVSESGKGGASNVVVTGSPATIVTGQTKTVTVINSFDTTTGNLTVSKSVVGTPPNGATFTVDVDCDDGTTHDATLTFNSAGTLTSGGPLPITGIPDGTTCTVGESGTAGALVNVSGSPAGIVKGETAQVIVTNTFLAPDVGSLTLAKNVTVVGHKPASTTFTVDVSCDDGTTESVKFTYNPGTGTITSDPDPPTFAGIPFGTKCTVTEQGLPAGWNTPTFDPSQPVEITALTPDVTVTVTNTFDPGSGNLRVRKAIGSGSPENGTQFVVRVDCTFDGQSLEGFPTSTTFTYPGNLGPHSFNGLPAGAVCSATETDDGGASSHDNGTSVTITVGATGTITVTNNFPGGTTVPTTPSSALFGGTGIEVAGASATRALSYTGSSSAILAKIAVVLLGIGSGLWLIARRRKVSFGGS